MLWSELFANLRSNTGRERLRHLRALTRMRDNVQNEAAADSQDLVVNVTEKIVFDLTGHRRQSSAEFVPSTSKSTWVYISAVVGWIIPMEGHTLA
jgi:hypothetical protein